MNAADRLAYVKTCGGCGAEIFMAVCRDGRWRPFETELRPPGKPRRDVPNRQMSASQPATDDAQPATDDIPTGNGCTPTTQGSAHRSAQPSTEGSPLGTQPTTGEGELPSNVIRFGRFGGQAS